MTKKDVQDYLDKGMFGAPQLKPDEQRKYLGTFRERIYLSMTITEMKSKLNLAHFKTELKNNPQQQVLINAAVPFNLQNDYMKATQEAACLFKIVDTENQSDGDAIGLVYIAETAVDVDPISVTEKYQREQTKRKAPVTASTTPAKPKQKPEKKGFFNKLFK